MAEGLVHLENDLRRVLGITSNVNTPTPAVSASKACNSPSRVLQSETSNTVPNKPPQKPKKRKENHKFQGNQLSEGFPYNKNVSSSSNTEGSGKLKEDAFTKKNTSSSNEEKKNAMYKTSRQRGNLDEPDRQLASDHYFNFADHKKPKAAIQNKSHTVFFRSAVSNNGDSPQNWRQPAREALLKGKALVTENRATSNSLPENGPNEKHPCQDGAERASKPLQPPKEFQKKARVRSRVKKEKKQPEELNQITTQVITAASAVVPTPNPVEVNDSPRKNPSSSENKDSAILTKEENQVAQSIQQKDANRRQEVLIASQDGEEVVRITIPPQPPQQKTQKKSKQAKNTEKNDPEKKEDHDDSSSSSSSSSEEEQTPRTERENLPLVFTIRKTELDSFRGRGVLPLKQISPKFPRAIFHCRLCSFHISSIPEVHRHMKDDRHVRLQNQERSRQTAALMPLPTHEIMEGVGHFVSGIYQCSGLTKEDLEIRRATTDILKTMLEIAFPGFSIRLYGSSFTELGLRSSNTNVGLIEVSPETKKDGLIIIRVLSWLRNPTNPFRHTNDDLNCRTPFIHFQHDPSGLNFSMVMESENAYRTSVLLQQYLLIDPRFAVLTVAFRTFARICRIDQPDLGSLPAHAFTLMVLYYLQQDHVLPVLHQLKTSDNEDEYLTAAEFLKLKSRGEWEPRQMTLGQLWLGLLKFYAYTFSHNEHAVCVRSLEPLLRSTKNWGNRRIAIEDPFHGNVNMGAFMSTIQTFDFFMDCMRNLFHYFWIPRTADGPLFVHLLLPGEEKNDDPTYCTPAEALRRMAELKTEDVKWEFDPEKILRLKRLPIICTICGADGHSKQQCVELEVPDVGFIPPPDFIYLGNLDTVCWDVFRNFSQRDVDVKNRQTIRNELESHIRNEYADAVLTIFGSSCNGFGFAESDVDLCLTFESNDDGKGLDFVEIVKKLAKILRRNRFFCDIVPISSAKVPIVKLRHRPTGLESDISLYNQLGRRNTHLLATYCAIDSRVRVLGYMAKLLAKQCEIGDASRGSLSSYAYILMVIHYLQQVKPPVIPVLQEITVEGVDRAKYIVEGWDTWFFDNTQDLSRVWPHQGANREPPSTLWLGFLLYYANLFDYRLQVVCIRQLNPLFRLEKMWTDRPIAIEDPFDLSHNLGSGVSLRMGAYIRRVFVTARKFFQTPVRNLPPPFTSLEEYLFNPKVLIAKGPPPNDRGCLICGKVGHKAKECENRGNRKGRDRRQSAQQQQGNPQNSTQDAMQNRNLPQLQQMNRARSIPHPQMNRYRQVDGQMNRERPPVYRQQQQQQNRYRPPVRPNNRRPDQPMNGEERILVTRREAADPIQPILG